MFANNKKRRTTRHRCISIAFTFFLFFSALFAASPLIAQTWQPVNTVAGSGSGGSGSDVSGFPAVTALNSSCASLSIGGTCTDSEGTQLFYIGLMDTKRIYGMMTDISEGSAYKSENTAGGGPSVNNGMVNTSVMTLPTTLMYYPAAVACKAFGASYYLPSKDELNLIWTNRSAINLASKAFDTGGTYYWSSTERNGTGAWAQRFSDGYHPNPNKTNSYRVRCVRR